MARYPSLVLRSPNIDCSTNGFTAGSIYDDEIPELIANTHDGPLAESSRDVKVRTEMNDERSIYRMLIQTFVV
jgi:hypothetical protein